MKKALICGVSGQDGAYLARFLLKKGYSVIGASRDAEMSRFENLVRLGIQDQVEVESMALNDFRSVLQVLTKTQPDEVYNLAGQTSVGLSFVQPVETLESISVGCLNLLESIRFLNKPIRFYNAGSSECFGDTGNVPATEDTPFHPRSPYAVAKATAFWQLANYREAYNLYACSGIAFNHESTLRPKRFVTQKIVAAVRAISQGSKEKLVLGNISVKRDWGWAPEYVEAMWLMLQQERPQDFIIATGESHPLEEFVSGAFACAGLNWREHVTSSRELYRPTDIAISRADPSRARRELKWEAKIKMNDLVRMMVNGEL
jgi:GDPmannose 4,6-dehydratase